MNNEIDFKEINLKIATLNLNGETFWSINRRPRLPQDLFNIKKIKEVIEGKGYQLIIPESLGKNTHFTVGFIVKKGIDIDNISIENITIENNVLLNEIPMNKIICCKFTKNGISYEILNVHLTKHTEDIKNALLDFLSSNNNDNNNVIRILLGDFNAYNDEQKDDKVQNCNNADFINDLMEKDFRKNYESTNKNYTFWASEEWKKLDHIFISGKNIDVKEIDVEETVNNNVNFYPIENALNNNKGFTDHSMLTAIIRDNKPK